MKIIFSPSKEMKLDNPIKAKWNPCIKTKNIIKKFSSLSPEEIQKSLKINERVLETVMDYIKGFDNDEAFRAIDLYNGLSFRTMDPQSFNADSIEYINKNLVILSAFYGPISPDSLIKPYRLDFNSSFKIENQSLKKYWQIEYNDYFIGEDIVLNLASDEFSSLLNRDNLKIIDFEFLEYDSKNKKIKKHSTISKKGRGSMVKYLADNRIENINDIKAFDYDNYKYSDDSNDKKFVFIKEI